MYRCYSSVIPIYLRVLPANLSGIIRVVIWSGGNIIILWSFCRIETGGLLGFNDLGVSWCIDRYPLIIYAFFTRSYSDPRFHFSIMVVFIVAN